MKLLVEYLTPNQSFHYVYENVRLQLQTHYPEIEEVEFKELPRGHNPHPGGPNGVSTMKIINKANNKTTVLSFWDRALQVFDTGVGWDNYNIVHLIGGLGVVPKELAYWQTSKDFKYSPLAYPLEFTRSYECIAKQRREYTYDDKIKQACFIGCLYHPRDEFTKILTKHPMFKVFGPDAGLRYEPYYDEMQKYAMTLSFNGAGEYSIRDFESMGVGIPVLRSETISPLYAPFIPNVNYVRASQPSDSAFIIYPETNFKQIADQFIAAAEGIMNNGELLTQISKNRVEYFNNYVLPSKIVDLFFKQFDLSLLK